MLWWITNFLSNRLQRVVINGSASTWSKVLSGVPQGSVLGPLLFIIYVNDLPDILHCCIQQYADDAKLYSIIKSYNDINSFQHNLDSIAEWSNKWLLNFNFNKCKHMQLGRSIHTTYTLLDYNNDTRINLNRSAPCKGVSTPGPTRACALVNLTYALVNS